MAGWKKNEDGDGDKVMKALAVALNAESGVDELFRRVVALEMKATESKPARSKAEKSTDNPEK